jgi:hypothetical protein
MSRQVGEPPSLPVRRGVPEVQAHTVRYSGTVQDWYSAKVPCRVPCACGRYTARWPHTTLCCVRLYFPTRSTRKGEGKETTVEMETTTTTTTTRDKGRERRDD